MDQTVRTFTLTGLVVLVLLLMHQLPEIHVYGSPLRSVNILSLLSPAEVKGMPDVVPTPAPPKPKPTIKVAGGKNIVYKEHWSKGVTPILDYSQGKDGGMEHFYSMLAHVAQQDRPVRIAYYGDSFIEGDIFTADLRQYFQDDFGGSGVGWVDMAPEKTAKFRSSINESFSGFQEFTAVTHPFDRSKQGISERYYTASEGAWAKFSGTKSYRHLSNWSRSVLFFKSLQPFTLACSVQGGDAVAQHIEPAQHLQKRETKGTMSSIKYSFSNISPNTLLYGVALESEKGVILDNFGLRAASGTTLQNIPLQTLSQFNELRPYDLIVVHFGLNVAVPGNAVSVIRGYADRMKKVIMHLRQAFPHASILLMSVSDRDGRTADGIATLPEVRHLVSFQQQVAADAKVAFLNTFQAMGGENSMRRFVDNRWANKDYTHLSRAGGRQLAAKIYPSFKDGLKNYKEREKLKQENQ